MKNTRLAKGYGLVSSEVVRNPEFSIREKGIYAHLCTYANSSGELNVSVNRVSSECGVTPSTVKRILSSLVKKGVIQRYETNYSKTTITKIIK